MQFLVILIAFTFYENQFNGCWGSDGDNPVYCGAAKLLHLVFYKCYRTLMLSFSDSLTLIRVVVLPSKFQKTHPNSRDFYWISKMLFRSTYEA